MSPRRSLLRAALADTSRPALGTWLKIASTELLELVAIAGFDFVVLDLEHSPMDLESASGLIGVARHAGLPAVVRVPDLHPGLVQRVLDAGAEGVMVPHVDTVEQAQAAAAAVRFPPRGTRGVGATSRVGDWGALPLEEYLRYGQEEVVLIAQVESADAARQAAAIGGVDGVDALLVGAADLAVSQGAAVSDFVVQDLIAEAVRGARAAGVPVGNAGGATAEAVRAALETGFGFTMLSNDASLFGAAATAAVQAARSVPLPTLDPHPTAGRTS
ncbi:2,4-dihydroxyhept-2-ene-1,7-dioic acid aldolase [Geodermatophilaceae bacterium NBWT11]|nr:2,4-dihydroxyhept-2-ene-1,7-dioic acid aldolase [Geodermatophilaceae bacterium NBWT11]